jgi:hypothetical protein
MAKAWEKGKACTASTGFQMVKIPDGTSENVIFYVSRTIFTLLNHLQTMF